MRSVARLLVHEVSEAFFRELPNFFCILRCNSGSMQWLNKIWICEKYSVSELNFLGKNLLRNFLYDLQVCNRNN